MAQKVEQMRQSNAEICQKLFDKEKENARLLSLISKNVRLLNIRSIYFLFILYIPYITFLILSFAYILSIIIKYEKF